MSFNAVRAFQAALDAVLPNSMIHSHLTRNGDLLHAGGRTFNLAKNVYVVGFGKAVSGMCRAVQDIIGDHVVKGLLSVPKGSMYVLEKNGKQSLLPIDDGRITVCEGAADNLPDVDSVIATERILEMVSHLTEEDLVVTLISGGGSALLCAPIEPISLNEKLWVTKTLAKKGAAITELNTIRKRMSKVKGGRLAEAAFPAQVLSLVLSDIIGDPMHMIASGPTVLDKSSQADCSRILKKFSILENIPPAVSEAIFSCKTSATLLRHWDNVSNILVGSNIYAVSASVKLLEELGYHTLVLSRGITGEAKEVGNFLMQLGITISQQMEGSLLPENNLKAMIDAPHRWSWLQDVPPSICAEIRGRQKLAIIGAGETTVTVTGSGKGGRNQELSLAAAISLVESTNKIPDDVKLCFLSAGTDGQDGPTDATGAVFDNKEFCIVNNFTELQDAKNALGKNDSYNYLNKFERNILKTGVTGTNVMDLQIITIEKTQ